MNQPWGLSGPQFLWIYGAGMAAVVAVPWLILLLRRVLDPAPPLIRAYPVLDAYEIGCLAGGAQRAAEVVIGGLAVSGALRVNSAGQISRADYRRLAWWSASDPYKIAVGDLPDGLRAKKVRRRLARDPGIVAIGGRLRADGLLRGRSWVVAAQVTAVALWLTLLVAGALRLAEGAHNHRPIGYLEDLYLLTFPLGFIGLLWLRRLRRARTRSGARYLKRLGQGDPIDVGRDAALLGIALSGVAAVADPALRAALLAGLPSYSSGSGSGGGGGGGGGCGGGCGG